MTTGAGAAGALGVLVLGMHRGGTSAIAGRFAAAGFSVGDDADRIAPDADNPLGYHELRGTVALNDEILGRLGGNWFHPPADARAGPATDDARAACVSRVRARLEMLLAATAPQPLLLKDPRIALLLDVWDPAIAGRLHPVLVVRHPTEVAASLGARNRIAPAGALAAWELSTARLLAGLAGREVTVAPYARLLESPGAATRVVTQATERLAPVRARRVTPAAGDDRLRPDLRRRGASGADLGSTVRLTAHQGDLWDWLDTLPPGRRRLRPPSRLCVASNGAHALTALELRRMRDREALAASLAGARGRPEETPAPNYHESHDRYRT